MPSSSHPGMGPGRVSVSFPGKRTVGSIVSLSHADRGPRQCFGEFSLLCFASLVSQGAWDAGPRPWAPGHATPTMPPGERGPEPWVPRLNTPSARVKCSGRGWALRRLPRRRPWEDSALDAEVGGVCRGLQARLRTCWSPSRSSRTSRLWTTSWWSSCGCGRGTGPCLHSERWPGGRRRPPGTS